jgi:hypothetical protein
MATLLQALQAAPRNLAFADALGAALVLLVLFNVAYFNGFGTDPVIGTPTRAQVTGT